MRIGSLFSGIGGLELGLERSGLGPVVWQVEKDEFCRAVLAKHWPDAERFEDVCTVGRANLASVDLICGGFPCQDVSSAGARTGLAGERSGLWREFARIVSELRPEWVLVENVESGAYLWVDAVLCELEKLEYACFPVPLSAEDVGAPHLRRRIFIVAADAHPQGQSAVAEHAEVAGTQASADAHGQGLQGPSASAHEGRTRSPERGWGPPVPDILRVVDGVSRGLDRPRRRIEVLGNAVVPQCAEVVGHMIQELAR
jgi:DNA (cytosine-5)-methyltransferase 1